MPIATILGTTENPFMVDGETKVPKFAKWQVEVSNLHEA
jgi:hypothetical protein